MKNEYCVNSPLHMDNNFVQKFLCLNDERDISK